MKHIIYMIFMVVALLTIFWGVGSTFGYPLGWAATAAAWLLMPFHPV